MAEEPVRSGGGNKGDFSRLPRELQPAQKDGIMGRNITQFLVRLIVLNVGLNPRGESPQLRTLEILTGNDLVDDVGHFRGFLLLIRRNRFDRLLFAMPNAEHQDGGDKYHERKEARSTSELIFSHGSLRLTACRDGALVRWEPTQLCRESSITLMDQQSQD